jgi:hypothetical protein
MRKIVNEIWILERFDAAKLAKYTRCLFQATLPLDDGLAMKLLDDVCGKARELKQVSFVAIRDDRTAVASVLLPNICVETRNLAWGGARMDRSDFLQPCYRLLWRA